MRHIEELNLMESYQFVKREGAHVSDSFALESIITICVQRTYAALFIVGFPLLVPPVTDG